MLKTKKLLYALIALFSALVVSLIAIIAALAATQQRVSSSLNVTYKATNVFATVNGEYKLKDDAAFTSMGPPAEFLASNSQTTKNVNAGDIKLTGTKTYVVLRYKITNNSSSNKIKINLTPNLTTTNMQVNYAYSLSIVTDDSKIIGTSLTDSVLGVNQTSYIYVKASIANLENNASFSGSLNFNLTYTEEATTTGSKGVASDPTPTPTPTPTPDPTPSTLSIHTRLEGDISDVIISAGGAIDSNMDFVPMQTLRDGEIIDIPEKPGIFDRESINEYGGRLDPLSFNTRETANVLRYEVTNFFPEPISVAVGGLRVDTNSTVGFQPSKYLGDASRIIGIPDNLAGTPSGVPEFTIGSGKTGCVFIKLEYFDYNDIITLRITPTAPGTMNGIATGIRYDVGDYIALGEYPQTYVGDELNAILKGTSETTGKTYKIYTNTEANPNQEMLCYEYMYEGNKYAYIENVSISENAQFNSGEFVEAGQGYFFRVEPIWFQIVADDGAGKLTLKAETILGNNYSSKPDYSGSDLEAYLSVNFAVDSGLNSIVISGENPTNSAFVWIPSEIELDEWIVNVDATGNAMRYATVSDFAIANAAYSVEHGEQPFRRVGRYFINSETGAYQYVIENTTGERGTMDAYDYNLGIGFLPIIKINKTELLNIQI